MSKGDGLTPKGFENLLALFSEDREEAGEKYEAARAGLHRYFRFKGCSDSASLADETMDRVAAKLETMDGKIEANPIAFLLGFASNIVLEYRRSVAKEIEYHENLHSPRAPIEKDRKEDEGNCLNECLARLPEKDRDTLVVYYTARGAEKQRRRDMLCKRLGCSVGALYTQIHRLKLTVRECLNDCMKKSL
ncbi:MAG: hypothetical protein ABL984_13575 [Pyrinomonadaceae bacterium]